MSFGSKSLLPLILHICLCLYGDSFRIKTSLKHPRVGGSGGTLLIKESNASHNGSEAGVQREFNTVDTYAVAAPVHQNALRQIVNNSEPGLGKTMTTWPLHESSVAPPEQIRMALRNVQIALDVAKKAIQNTGLLSSGSVAANTVLDSGAADMQIMEDVFQPWYIGYPGRNAMTDTFGRYSAPVPDGYTNLADYLLRSVRDEVSTALNSGAQSASAEVLRPSRSKPGDGVLIFVPDHTGSRKRRSMVPWPAMLNWDVVGGVKSVLNSEVDTAISSRAVVVPYSKLTEYKAPSRDTIPKMIKSYGGNTSTLSASQKRLIQNERDKQAQIRAPIVDMLQHAALDLSTDQGTLYIYFVTHGTIGSCGGMSIGDHFSKIVNPFADVLPAGKRISINFRSCGLLLGDEPKRHAELKLTNLARHYNVRPSLTGYEFAVAPQGWNPTFDVLTDRPLMGGTNITGQYGPAHLAPPELQSFFGDLVAGPISDWTPQTGMSIAARLLDPKLLRTTCPSFWQALGYAPVEDRSIQQARPVTIHPASGNEAVMVAG